MRIVGGVTERNVVPILIEGLHRLEYRGYDSVGIAYKEKKCFFNQKPWKSKRP